jgi:hypothetical protein
MTKLRSEFLVDVADILDWPGLDTQFIWVCDAVPDHSYTATWDHVDSYNAYGEPCKVCGVPEETAATMRALLPFKRKAPNYQGLLEDVMAKGQMVPIHTIGAFVNNGGHRLTIAVDLGWDTILCTEVGSSSSDDSLVNSWLKH